MKFISKSLEINLQKSWQTCYEVWKRNGRACCWKLYRSPFSITILAWNSVAYFLMKPTPLLVWVLNQGMTFWDLLPPLILHAMSTAEKCIRNIKMLIFCLYSSWIFFGWTSCPPELLFKSEKHLSSILQTFLF